MHLAEAAWPCLVTLSAGKSERNRHKKKKEKGLVEQGPRGREEKEISYLEDYCVPARHGSRAASNFSRGSGTAISARHRQFSGG